jgi:C4-dicarboxylate-specific signal transduction histidine kinase
VRARQLGLVLAQAARLSTLGGMAAGLAHEINQPLAAIVSYARGCARRIQVGETHVEALLEVVDEISTQALRAGEVLRRIREFVRHTQLPRIRVDLNALAREALHFAAMEANELGIVLVLDLADEPLDVEADGIQIEQVMLNLVRNGFEAMAHTDGERQLRIQTRTTEDGTAEFAVHDTGEGVSASIAGRLFDPFFTTRRDGLGLGLAISRSIVEAHGGRLWTTPNHPRGSTFRFTLPAVSGDAKDAA